MDEAGAVEEAVQRRQLARQGLDGGVVAHVERRGPQAGRIPGVFVGIHLGFAWGFLREVARRILAR